jgi:hypothetical protein
MISILPNGHSANPSFPLGEVVATRGAIEALQKSGQSVTEFLVRHQQGEWGIVDDKDKAANDRSLVDGSRILSAYRTKKGDKLWVITEAVDENGHRAATTFLLPDEY